MQGWNNPEDIARKRLQAEKDKMVTSNPPASRDLMGRQRASTNVFAWLRAKLCGAQPERTLDAFWLPQDTFGSGVLCY